MTATAPAEGLFSTQLGSTGPRVVFLHGLFGQGKNWTTIAKGLSESARVILVDLPNHGRSLWTDHFSYPDMADRVAELLQTQGGDDQWAVVGHWMGEGGQRRSRCSGPSSWNDSASSMSHRCRPGRSEFDTFIRGMRSIDLEHSPDERKQTPSWPCVSDPVIPLLLQNLRRDPPSSNGRWRCR